MFHKVETDRQCSLNDAEPQAERHIRAHIHTEFQSADLGSGSLSNAKLILDQHSYYWSRFVNTGLEGESFLVTVLPD